jgi:hypothetical protein
MADELRLLGEYTTQQAHDGYPAGSKCMAYRSSEGKLILKMHDGGTVKLDSGWFCAGLEAGGGDWCRSPMAEIIAEEDKRVLEDIDRAIVEMAKFSPE